MRVTGDEPGRAPEFRRARPSRSRAHTRLCRLVEPPSPPRRLQRHPACRTRTLHCRQQAAVPPSSSAFVKIAPQVQSRQRAEINSSLGHRRQRRHPRPLSPGAAVVLPRRRNRASLAQILGLPRRTVALIRSERLAGMKSRPDGRRQLRMASEGRKGTDTSRSASPPRRSPS